MLKGIKKCLNIRGLGRINRVMNKFEKQLDNLKLGREELKEDVSKNLEKIAKLHVKNSDAEREIKFANKHITKIEELLD